jgi:hypothetical protein
VALSIISSVSPALRSNHHRALAVLCHNTATAVLSWRVSIIEK